LIPQNELKALTSKVFQRTGVYHYGMTDLYIGLMSGTSMDGVDGALVDFSQQKPFVSHVFSAPLAPDLRAELLALNSPGHNELHRAALAANALAHTYAQVVHALLAASGWSATDIRAIGAHGQTVRHQPDLKDAAGKPDGYTLQLNNPALLAELTGIEVVADFRSRDVAAGGQGAPLAPFFHRAWFAPQGVASGNSDAAKTIGVLNIGGISNLSILQPDGTTLGFDCGPGNALLDMWCQQHTGAPYDDGGAWGDGGVVNHALLQAMLSEPYFALPTPKSTGRDLFNCAWLEKHLASFATEAPQNVQRTLIELTASPIKYCGSSYEKRSGLKIQELIVCGGGAFNTALMQRLQALMPSALVVSSAERGLPPQDVEATAFAWLARQTVLRLPLPLPSVTGSSGPRVLGCIYPA
jgi:anhydro-N-acetylmuramic acid kinase